MRYEIKPGIAAHVEVHCEAFPMNYGYRRSAFIFMAEGKLPEKGIADPVKWGDLPMQVQAAINKHFGTVFALPVERRGEYLASFKDNPIVVEV